MSVLGNVLTPCAYVLHVFDTKRPGKGLLAHLICLYDLRVDIGLGPAFFSFALWPGLPNGPRMEYALFNHRP